MEKLAIYADGYRPSLKPSEINITTATKIARVLLSDGWECTGGMLLPSGSELCLRTAVTDFDNTASYTQDPAQDIVIGPYMIGDEIYQNGVGIWRLITSRVH